MIPKEVSIVRAYPPNYAGITRRFPSVRGRQGVLYAWGDRIYNPSGGMVPPWLVVHELTHLRQQTDYDQPSIWWGLYMDDAQFRFEQELEAHKQELVAYATQEPNLWRREQYLDRVAARLASPLYDLKFLS